MQLHALNQFPNGQPASQPGTGGRFPPLLSLPSKCAPSSEALAYRKTRGGLPDGEVARFGLMVLCYLCVRCLGHSKFLNRRCGGVALTGLTGVCPKPKNCAARAGGVGTPSGELPCAALSTLSIVPLTPYPACRAVHRYCVWMYYVWSKETVGPPAGAGCWMDVCFLSSRPAAAVLGITSPCCPCRAPVGGGTTPGRGTPEYFGRAGRERGGDTRREGCRHWSESRRGRGMAWQGRAGRGGEVPLPASAV